MSKYFLNWSSGKDATMALYHCLNKSNKSIDLLLTTVNEAYERVSMHGLRQILLHDQIEALGMPSKQIAIPKVVDMNAYDAIMREELIALKKAGYSTSVFGDIFLEDLRTYRETKLEEVGMDSYFPLWKKDTKEQVQEFIDLGFKAITVCVDANKLDASFVGRELDASFLNDLPAGVDPCGENGEFHTFVFDGPIFKRPVAFEIGEIVKRSYALKEEETDNCFQKTNSQPVDNAFWYADLVSV
ncbi:MAG: diphthine--ammonia ligase [Flavobacteriaceae bacterium]|nr:diphthine--ammonia ligase [Flavobacteriaceae bacterium]